MFKKSITGPSYGGLKFLAQRARHGLNRVKASLHTGPQADGGFFFCHKHSDHAKNFVGPLENF